MKQIHIICSTTQGTYLKIGQRTTNRTFFLISSVERRKSVHKNSKYIYLNLNLVLLWISSFKRLMKEQEFQECFCRFLPFSYTCSQYPDTTYCRLQIKSGMQTSEGSLMLTEQVFSCQIQVDFTLSQFVTPNQAKSKGTNSYSKEI